LGFGIIDPWQGKLALQEIHRCKEELGLHGIGEFNPARQHFFPNDLRFYPLWEEIQKQGLPVLFHSGLAAGAGTPGGGGTKLKYTQPIHLDDVAADFPELQIISDIHPGRGKRKVSPSPATKAITTSTCPARSRNIFPPS
jgi:predicted TIM-barrel fold metal-dependent hydrolase